MILHWTGKFKGLNHGKESYTLPNVIWEGIGALTASSGSTIPSVYGCRIPNIKKDHHICTTDMWSFWTLDISPILLWQQFDNVKYYKHFILLVKLLTTCLKFKVISKEIDFIHGRFIDWVEKYERFYYQNNASHMSTCLVTIHAFLHIANSIKTCRPYILEDAQLTQVKAIYDLADELALQPCLRDLPLNAFQSPSYPSCILLHPQVVIQQGLGIQGLSKLITTTLSTQFGLHVSTIWKHLQEARIEDDARDIIHSSGLMKQTADRWDTTFDVILVDQFAHIHHHKPVLKPQTFYGQHKHLHLITFTYPTPRDLEGLNIHLYNTAGSLDFIDVMSIQALVGHMEYIIDGGGWAIIDQSGTLACAERDPSDNDNELDT
ncbi:hypothetical protein EI94DRAFT_1773184 [Lactarius quietus]|nr:hypothetical protein EI94DRAFT_1773184 [Lactarius quietus]